jgi:hypothetical protein
MGVDKEEVSYKLDALGMSPEERDAWLVFLQLLESPKSKALRVRQLARFRAQWAGRIFMCTETGDVLTIPEDVCPRDFYKFGESFVDVGDGFYARFGGSPKEITHDE